MAFLSSASLGNYSLPTAESTPQTSVVDHPHFKSASYRLAGPVKCQPHASRAFAKRHFELVVAASRCRVALEYRLSRRRDPLHKLVSPDGKTMRETFKGTIQGTPIEIVAVPDR
jgi:hypothetical protein